MGPRRDLRQGGQVGYLTRWEITSSSTNGGGHDHKEGWISRSHGGHGREASDSWGSDLPKSPIPPQTRKVRGRRRVQPQTEGRPQLRLTSVYWSINFVLGKASLCLRWPASCAQDLALRVRIRNLYANYLTRLQARIAAGRFVSRVCACCTWESSCNQGSVTVSIMRMVSPCTPQRLRTEQRKCASPGNGAGRVLAQQQFSFKNMLTKLVQCIS